MATQINPSRRGITIKIGWMNSSEIQHLNNPITSISNDKAQHNNEPIIKPELIGGKGAPLHPPCIGNGIGT